MPPESSVNPRLTSALASSLAFFTMALEYDLNSGWLASWKHTALAAIADIVGPP